MSNMYKLKAKFHDYNDDDYIIVETLTNTVCLMNCRTNSVGWVTKHVLGLEYDPKPKSQDKGIDLPTEDLKPASGHSDAPSGAGEKGRL